MAILWPLKVPERGNAVTQRKTLEIEHSCLFIHHSIWIYPFPYLILFNTPKKSLLKSSYLSQIFVPKKSQNWKCQTKKNPSITPVASNPKYPPWTCVALKKAQKADVLSNSYSSGSLETAVEQDNRPFPHSCKQRHQVEARVDKIQWFVWNCPPEPRPHFFMFAHRSVMRGRSIVTY